MLKCVKRSEVLTVGGQKNGVKIAEPLLVG